MINYKKVEKVLILTCILGLIVAIVFSCNKQYDEKPIEPYQGKTILKITRVSSNEIIITFTDKTEMEFYGGRGLYTNHK